MPLSSGRFIDGDQRRARAMPVLELQASSKHFGAIHALDDVSLTIAAGEVVGLMGDNGAGKSTLVKVVAGNFPPTAGTLLIDGRPASFTRPSEARQSGIEVVYQDLALCDNLPASINIFMGRELTRWIGPLRVLDFKATSRRAAELFPELKSETRPRDTVRDMSGGQRQAVAIARTRLSNPKIVLMDEPTAAISVRQVAEVLNLVRRLREQGIAVVLISHRMPDVFAVADRIIVLRRGAKVADKPIAGTSPHEVTGLITGAITAAGSAGRGAIPRMSEDLERAIAARSQDLVGSIVGQQSFWVLAAALLAAVILSLATEAFATPQNLFNVTRNFAFVAIVAIGMTAVIITGGIDLSVGSTLCLSAMVTGVTLNAGHRAWVGIAAGLAAALAVGLVNGVLITAVRIPPFVATLGMLSIARSLAMVASQNRMVYQFGPDHEAFLWLGGGSTLGIPN